jgi:CelD/BcsL family acetyltransferase involved in cellulose biosynthesis
MDSINTKWEVRNIAEFGVIALAWDELNKRNNNQAILCASFVSALLDAFGSSEECLVLAWHENNLVFASIFEKKSRYRWQTFQPSQAPLGCIICSEDMLNEQTLKQVAKLLPSQPLLLDLTQIDSAQFPKDSTSFLFTSPYISTGSIELPGDFTAYFASLSKNARQNFNKARNRLAKLDITTKLEIVTDKDEMKKFIGIYGDIESDGWKDAEGTAVHRDNSQGQFYSDMFYRFAEQEAAQIWCYYFDDEIVAVDLCVLMNEVLVILKTTYAEKHAKYSPSLLMKLDAYEKLGLEGKVKTIEYFGKTKDWHRRLQCEERDIYHATWCKFPTLFRLFNTIKKKLT